MCLEESEILQRFEFIRNKSRLKIFNSKVSDQFFLLCQQLVNFHPMLGWHIIDSASFFNIFFANQENRLPL